MHVIFRTPTTKGRCNYVCSSGVLELDSGQCSESLSPKRFALDRAYMSQAQKVVHVNPSEYEVRPFDLVTEGWVTDKDAR